MAFIYSTTTQAGIDINNVYFLDAKGAPEYPAPPFLAGELAWGTDGSEWVYGTASISIASGSAVVFAPTPGSWSVALLSSSGARSELGDLVGVVGGTTGSIGVSAPSGTQTASFFWVQRAGNAQRLLAAASTNANTALHSSSVPGALTSASGAGTSVAVSGIVWSVTASVSGTAYNAVLNYPTVGAND